MTNLNILKTFRTKESKGQSITEEKNGSALSLQQLDEISGGLIIIFQEMNAYDFNMFRDQCPNDTYGKPVTNRFGEDHCRISDDTNSLVAILKFNGRFDITFMDDSTRIQRTGVTVEEFYQFYKGRHDVADLVIGLRTANYKSDNPNITDKDDEALEALSKTFSGMPINYKSENPNITDKDNAALQAYLGNWD